jgi:hypothetical protein
MLKHLLGCRHLLSHHAEGIKIQTYCAIIACLLINLWTGRQPTKRTHEMLCYYLMGWADEDELLAPLAKLKARDAASSRELRGRGVCANGVHVACCCAEFSTVTFGDRALLARRHSHRPRWPRRSLLECDQPANSIHRAEQYWVRPLSRVFVRQTSRKWPRFSFSP